LILRKIIKIIATRCQILRLKYTKFDFGWGSAPDPAGGAYSAPPDPLAQGGRGGRGRREGEGREKDGRGGEGKWSGLLIRGGGEGREGKKGEGVSPPRLLRFPPGSRGARIVTARNT